MQRLLALATRRFAPDSRSARDWLHSPHPALAGATPAACAWYSDRTAFAAACLLIHLDLTTSLQRNGGDGSPARAASDGSLRS